MRAQLIVGAHAWSVENGVRHKALPAGPALVANGGGKQVGESPCGSTRPSTPARMASP